MSISRYVNIGLVAAMITGAIVTYAFKYRAEAAAAHVAGLKSAIERERQSLSLLKAEWSVLEQPSRLQTLVERYQDYLGLQPFSLDQVATLEEIPVRPVELGPGDTSRTMGGYAGGPANPIR
jgi:hypothetical protein